jgi:hypothetical protein
MHRGHWLVALISFILVLPFAGCGGDDDDDNDAGVDDTSIADDTSTTDDADDDSHGWSDDTAFDDDTAVADDTTLDDTSTDDTGDDDTIADDYIAPWPQSNVEAKTYDENPSEGPLRLKADEYDIWSVDHHQPYYGGLVHAKFTDETYATPVSYHGYGDCTIWSGTYLGGQAFRYWVTGDATAKANAIRIVNALSGHLHVTGRTGFIARYRAPQDSIVYGGDDWCDDPNNDRCHRVEDGDFAGDFWWGETSRDQYTGWFYGMALAYDLVDDEDTRDIIRADMAEVLTELMANDWWILDEANEPTDAAPNVLTPMRLSWLTTGYHITGSEAIRIELQKYLRNSERLGIQINSIALMNRYAQYYGNNLAHTNWYNLLRLGKVYFSQDDYEFLVDTFETQVHTFTRLSHNPWFNGIFMSQGDYTPANPDPYQEQLVADLNEFPECPNIAYHIAERTTYTLDPLSQILHDLEVQYPWIEDIIGGVEYQAIDAFPVSEQISAGFKFQQNPFRFQEDGVDDPSYVNSGTDYLVAYWLSAYHKHLTKDM